MAKNSALTRRSLLLRGSATGAAVGAALATAVLPTNAAAARNASHICVLDGLQPTVLTISGAGVQPNRGKPQAVADRMLHVHGHDFDSAWTCGIEAINSLEQHTVKTQLEYDGTEHQLKGPSLESVLQASGVDVGKAIAQGHWLLQQGIDGYRAQLPVAQAIRWRMLLASRMDDQALAMGGVGPLWAIFAPETIDDLKQLPIKERFQNAVWGLYYMQVSAQQK